MAFCKLAFSSGYVGLVRYRVPRSGTASNEKSDLDHKIPRISNAFYYLPHVPVYRVPAPKPVVAGCEKSPPPACEVVVVPKRLLPGWLVSPKVLPAGLKAVLPKADGWA